MTVSEQILSVIPGSTEHQRLVILHRSIETRETVQLYRPQSADSANAPHEPAEQPERVSMPLSSRPFCEQIQSIRERPIVLRQESFSPAVGWFTQSEMELTAGQWAAMKLTILPGPTTCTPAAKSSRKRSRPTACVPHQRVLSASGEVIALAIDRDQAVPA